MLKAIITRFQKSTWTGKTVKQMYSRRRRPRQGAMSAVRRGGESPTEMSFCHSGGQSQQKKKNKNSYRHGKYFSAQYLCAQAQSRSRFNYYHSPIRWQIYTTGERPGVEPTTWRAF